MIAIHNPFSTICGHELQTSALQVMSNIVPAKWFYLIAKDVMIKGLGVKAIWKEMFILSGMTLFLLAVALKKYKIRLA